MKILLILLFVLVASLVVLIFADHYQSSLEDNCLRSCAENSFRYWRLEEGKCQCGFDTHGGTVRKFIPIEKIV